MAECSEPRRVCDLGETELLRLLEPFCGPGLIGDDAAVLEPTPGHGLVVSTDLLVEGVHFSEATTPAHAVGWRAAAANLSDLAAMGAMPWALSIGLGLPPETPVDWVLDCYRGITDCLNRYGGQISGGDLVRSPQRHLAITILGQVLPEQLIQRRDARPGDWLVASGAHGASRAGLALLLGELPPASGSDDWIAAHRYPQPRLDWLEYLNRCCPAGRPWRVGGMDSSDGLADAVCQIAAASGCGVRLQRSQLPLPPGLTEAVGQARAEHWCLYGGEDFELVLALEPSWAKILIANGQGIHIGEVVDSGCWLDDEPLARTAAFNHFRPASG